MVHDVRQILMNVQATPMTARVSKMKDVTTWRGHIIVPVSLVINEIIPEIV